MSGEFGTGFLGGDGRLGLAASVSNAGFGVLISNGTMVQPEGRAALTNAPTRQLA